MTSIIQPSAGAVAPAVPAGTGSTGEPGTAHRDDPPDARALEAARAFEKLLIHDMLKSARRAGATLGEAPSNARSTYDDMMDEHLAEIVGEAGGFGLAPMLAKRLDGGIDRASAAADTVAGAARTAATEGLVAVGTDAGGHASPTERLATAELLRLRALVRPDGSASGPRGAASATASSAASNVASGVTPGAGTAGIRPLAFDAARPAITGTAAATAYTSLAPSSETAASGEVRSRDAAHRAFIAPLLPEAIRSARRLGTSPDVVLAVAALESGWGEHVATDANGRSSHNLFGIKARPGEAGAVSHATTEYLGGRRQRVVADFRAFADPGAAVGGFADFVLDNPRYARALEHAGDPSEFLRRLHAAGYATDPRYADKAIAVMQRVRALRENPA